MLLLDHSFLHKRILVLLIWYLSIRLYKIPMILLDGIASFGFLLNAYLIVGAATLIARVTTQATILVRRVSHIFFVFIFNNYFLEQVVRRVG